VHAHAGQKLAIEFSDERATLKVESDAPLAAAQKFPVTEAMVREQLGRLGDTPYELTDLDLSSSGAPMVPKSVLNDLRRQAVQKLLEMRRAAERRTVQDVDGLSTLRDALPRKLPQEQRESKFGLHVLARTLDQLRTVLGWVSDGLLAGVYCDFEDIRRYREAVTSAREANVPITLATLRIIKPHEHGLLQQIADLQPDAVLVRNLAAVSFFHEVAPQLPQIGDYSLNISNELTAGIFAEAGLARMVPSYDLSWRQLEAMVRRFDPSRFECVIHQHMPMFHMEHCVFAHTLSSGKDYRDCGRPCESHQVDLKDRVGEAHPLIPDVGCRNTVFNARAQSAAEYIPRMRELGIGNFRVELLRERPEEIIPLLDRYAGVIGGASDPAAAVRSLRVLHQLGVTRGTLERE
jgi:putative protease